ncbi:MAG: putative rane protein [Anaerocolumna sp.]|jgi:stage II sporulation protein D|nr:putative rane protein [Anaerocolumna sp.]
MKKKIWLLGICVFCLILIFAVNTIKLLKQDNKSGENIITNQEMMTAQKALTLLNYLGDFKEELDYLEDRDNYFLYDDGLSFIDIAVDKFGFKKEDITNNLSFTINTDSNSAMPVSEFLQLYETITAQFPEDTAPVKEKSLYLLGQSKSNTSVQALSVVTNEGIYNYTNALDMGMYYQEGKVVVTEQDDADKGEDLVKDTQNSLDENIDEYATGSADANNIEENTEINTNVDALASAESKPFNLDSYIDSKIIVLVKGNQFIYIKGISEEETTLHNIWVTEGKGDTLKAFLLNLDKSFTTKYQLSSEIKNTVCDVVIKDKKIVKISLKPDVVNGKVLSGGKNFIEIEKYGKIDLDENYKIYKIHGEFSMEVTNSILVGYENTDFVVAGGKIVAALIKEPIKAENIRVLIKTNNYSNLFHDKITLTATKDYTVSAGDVVKKHKAGDIVTIKITNKLFEEGRMKIATDTGEGKITVTSINRSSGNPSYRGTMEIALEGDKMILINELSLEEYLYAVVPSEMPTSYSIEALKAQAICARSYAYNQLLSNAYSNYGAHVDDSVNFQVYNNMPENDISILAVKDTYGKVLEFENEVITAYYFSTSCGHTSSINQVWASGSNNNYLEGKIQTLFNIVDGEAVYASAITPDTVNFSNESTFASFISKPTFSTYDSEFAWYRWKVTISKDDLKQSIDKSLAARYNVNPSNIQTLVKGQVKNNPVYESKPINTIGNVNDIIVGKREDSGIISELILVGSKATIKVIAEYNIRVLLAPLNSEVVRQDESTVDGLSMLPSAYFTMKKGDDKISFIGGGYGHGVGMSQNGAKAMADSGKDYETILQHFYSNVELGYIYE